jgi:hypothetical protein
MNWTPTMTQGSLKHYSVKREENKKNPNEPHIPVTVDRRVYVAVMYSGD